MPDLYDWLRPEKKEPTPDRALARLGSAVLIQAIQDASSGPETFRQSSLQWLRGETTDGMTFQLVCDLIGRDPEDIRQKLRMSKYIPHNNSTVTTTQMQSVGEKTQYIIRSAITPVETKVYHCQNRRIVLEFPNGFDYRQLTLNTNERLKARVNSMGVVDIATIEQRVRNGSKRRLAPIRVEIENRVLYDRTGNDQSRIPYSQHQRLPRVRW